MIVPAYNEADNLKRLVPKILEVFNRYSINGEIILVNDGSTDNTKEICESFAKNWEDIIKVVNHERNLGKTMAFSSGIYASCGDYCFLFEADLQYDPRDIVKFLPLLDIGYDIVSGWRRHRADPPHRILLSKAQNLLQRLFFGTNLSDHNSGFIGYRRSVALILFNPEFIEEIGLGRSYHRMVLSIARRLGFTIDEVSVRHYPRASGKSYISGWKTTLETAKAFVKLYFLFTFKWKKLLESYHKSKSKLLGRMKHEA